MKTPKSIFSQITLLFKRQEARPTSYKKLRTAGLAFEKEGHFEQAINSYLAALTANDTPKAHDLAELIKRATQLAADQLKIARSNTFCALAEIAFQKETFYPSFSTYRLIEEAYLLNPDSNKIKSLYLRIVQYFRPSLIIGEESRGAKGFEFSRDGKYVITSQKDGAVLVWEVSAPDHPIILKGHEDEVLKATFNKDYTKVLTYSEDDTVRIWSLSNPENHIIIGGKERRLTGAFFSENESHILTVGYDGSIKVWMQNKLDAPITLQKEDKSEDRYYEVSFSKDEQQVLAYSSKQVWVWHLTVPDSPIVLEGHIDYIMSATFNKGGDKVLTACRDGSIHVWLLSNPDHYIKLKGHHDGAKGAILNKAQTQVLSWGYDNAVQIWELSNRKNVITLKGHDDYFYGVKSAVFSKDESKVLSWGMDDTARIWTLSDPESPVVLEHNEESVYNAIFSKDEQRVLSNCHDHIARVWDLSKPENPILLTGHKGFIKTVDFNEDEKKVFTTSKDGTARVWTLDDPAYPTKFQMPLSDVYDEDGYNIGFSGAMYNKDEDIILIWCPLGIWLWRPQDHDNTIFIDCSDDEISNVSLSEDEQYLLAWIEDGEQKVWDLSKLQSPVLLEEGALITNEEHDLKYKNRSRIDGLFSPDKKYVLTWDWNGYGSIRVWPSANPEITIDLKGHTNEIWEVCFSKDSQRILSYGYDGTAIIWNLADPENPIVLQHKTSVDKACFNEDERRVFSYTHEAVYIWDLNHPQDPFILKPEPAIISAHFNKTETQVLTCTDDAVYIWDLDVEKVKAKLYKTYPTMMRQPLLKSWKQEFGLEGQYQKLMSAQ